jgi:hypothetical protein
MRLEQVADRMDAAAAELTSAGAALVGVEPAPRSFGAAAGGRLGELGRALHGQCSAALGARAREAAAHGARLADSAQVLRSVAAGYAAADDEARRRHEVEGGP